MYTWCLYFTNKIHISPCTMNVLVSILDMNKAILFYDKNNMSVIVLFNLHVHVSQQHVTHTMAD